MKLSESEIAKHLETLPNWSLEDGQLVRTFGFGSYASGVAFAMKVAMLAEKTDHHPDSLLIAWKNVRVAYITHSAGGLTELDFAAAARVDGLV